MGSVVLMVEGGKGNVRGREDVLEGGERDGGAKERIQREGTNIHSIMQELTACKELRSKLKEHLNGREVLILCTVEPLYNEHFGTSHFWVIFAVI